MNEIREIIHVLPINDINYHIEDIKCHCNPKAEEIENGNLIVIHNSFDGRELKEQEAEDEKSKTSIYG